MSNSPLISTSGSLPPRPLFKALCVVGMGWDTPTDTGLAVFDSKSQLAVVSCRAGCNTGGVNRWSV
jgi:hypothetical protein